VRDRFHISRHLNQASEKVHRPECEMLSREKDDSLKHSIYLWLADGMLVQG